MNTSEIAARNAGYFGIDADLSECERFDAQIFSDLFKDAYGHRPRFSLAGYSAAELDALWEHTCREHEIEMEREERLEQEAMARFEDLLNSVADSGAGNHKTALRWLLEAEGEDGMNGDVSYFLWKHGLNSFKRTQPYFDLLGRKRFPWE